MTTRPSPRNIIITGGGSGIGYALAQTFIQQNARVALIGRRNDVLQRAAQALGEPALACAADVSQLNQITAAVEQIVNQFSVIDVLINAAGFGKEFTTETPLEEAERHWDAIVGACLKGSFLMSMAVIPHLRRPGGRIINISSIAAFTGGRYPGLMAYAAAKSGLHGLTYSLARELGPHGITVNIIAPGLIADAGAPKKWDKERIQSSITETPAGRAGCTDDIVAAACYLSSQEASFVTGEILHVNGGWFFGH